VLPVVHALPQAHHAPPVNVLVQSADSVLYTLNITHQFQPHQPHHIPQFHDVALQAQPAHQAHPVAVITQVKFHVLQAITIIQPFHHQPQPHHPAFKYHHETGKSIHPHPHHQADHVHLYPYRFNAAPVARLIDGINNMLYDDPLVVVPQAHQAHQAPHGLFSHAHHHTQFIFDILVVDAVQGVQATQFHANHHQPPQADHHRSAFKLPAFNAAHQAHQAHQLELYTHTAQADQALPFLFTVHVHEKVHLTNILYQFGLSTHGLVKVRLL